MSQAAHPLFHGEPGDGQLSRSPTGRWINMVDAASLSESGVKVVYAALWPPFRGRPGHSAFDEAWHQLEAFDDFVMRRPLFAKVTTATQARSAMRRGAIATFMQLEGAEGITRVSDVDRLYEAGVRCITVVHFVSTQLGGAAAGQLQRAIFRSDVSGLHTNEGLSELGRAVVSRMMDLGIVVDVAHGSDALVKDVLELAEARGVPLLVSHTGSRVLAPMERNLPDELARRIVAGGGLIGVSVYADQLDTGEVPGVPKPWADYERHTCDDVIAHWSHFAKLVGPDALVLGSDFNGPISRGVSGGSCPRGLTTTQGLSDLWAALEFRGVPKPSLDSQAERLLNFIERVEATAKRR